MMTFEPHPEYTRRWASEAICAICGGDSYPTKETHEGRVCSHCRRTCHICEDWMANEPETEHNGHPVHVSCEVDAIVETLPNWRIPSHEL